MSHLTGVIAAAATPLRPDLSIDIDGLLDHCSYLLGEGGCDGVNLLGTTGEATSFSVEQRLAAMQAIGRSGLPLERLMVGTGAAALDDACRLSQEAKSNGFVGVLLLPPFYYKGIDGEGLINYIESFIGRVGRDDLRLYLYHFPANSGVPFSLDIISKLRDRYPDQVAGLKDSSGEIEFSAMLAKRFPGFDVFPSAEGTIAKARQLGFAGCISATANVTGQFAQTAWSGVDTEARAESLNRAIEIRSTISKFPLVPAVKAALAILSGNTAWNRVVPPLTPLAESQCRHLKQGLSEIGMQSSKIDTFAAIGQDA